MSYEEMYDEGLISFDEYCDLKVLGESDPIEQLFQLGIGITTKDK